MTKERKYKVKTGCGDFNEGDYERYQGRVGIFKRKIESGWLQNTILLEFPDNGDQDVFWPDDIVSVN
jgi:hypothetical protein